MAADGRRIVASCASLPPAEPNSAATTTAHLSENSWLQRRTDYCRVGQTARRLVARFTWEWRRSESWGAGSNPPRFQRTAVPNLERAGVPRVIVLVLDSRKTLAFIAIPTSCVRSIGATAFRSGSRAPLGCTAGRSREAQRLELRLDLKTNAPSFGGLKVKRRLGN